MKALFQKYTQIFLIILFLVLTYSCYFILELSKERPKIGEKASQDFLVTPILLPSVNEVIKLQYPSNVRVRNMSLITPRTTGQVVWMHPNFKNGTSFKKDQILFRLDNPVNKASLRVQKSRLAKEKAAYNLVKAQSDSAIEQWKLINPDLEVPALIAKKPELTQIKANIAEIKANIINLKEQIAFQSFHFPFSGVIDQVDIAIGTNIAPNQSYGQAYRPQDIELVIQIPQSEIFAINDQEFDARFKIEGQEFKGAIDRLSGNIDTSTRMQEIIIKPERKAIAFLRNGMFIDVELVSKKPFSIYKVTEDLLEERKFLRVLTAEDSIQKETIEIVGRNNDYIFIKSYGKDKRVIKGNIAGIFEGLKVKTLPQ